MQPAPAASVVARVRGVSIQLAVLAVATSAAPLAQAHPAPAGIIGYPALMLHPLLVTHQALALAAAALLLFQSPRLSRWRSILAFVIAIAAGNLAQGLIPNLFSWYWMASAALLTASGAAAAALDPVPPRLALPLIAALGLIVGLDVHPEGPGAWARAAALSATATTGSLLLLVAGFAGSYALPRPARVLARILAAWIAAAVLMILAFALRP